MRSQSKHKSESWLIIIREMKFNSYFYNNKDSYVIQTKQKLLCLQSFSTVWQHGNKRHFCRHWKSLNSYSLILHITTLKFKLRSSTTQLFSNPLHHIQPFWNKHYAYAKQPLNFASIYFIPQSAVTSEFLANSVAECLEGKEQLNNKINTSVASMLGAKATSRWQSLSPETVASLRMMSQKKYHMSTNESPPACLISGPL